MNAHSITVNVYPPSGDAAALLPPGTLVASVIVGDGTRSYRKPMVLAFEPSDETEDCGVRQMTPRPAHEDYGLTPELVSLLERMAREAVAFTRTITGVR